MAQYTAAGSKIYISSVSTTAASQSAFEALTWHEIGEVVNVGEFGKEYQDIPTNTINQRQTKHNKGAFDEGMLNVSVYADPDDQGQTTVQTALTSDYDYGIKIELNDAGTGSPSSPTTYFYLGKIMSYRKSISDVNSMVTAAVGIALNSEPIEVAAV